CLAACRPLSAVPLVADREAAMISPTLSLEEAAAHRWGAVAVGAGPAGALGARQLAQRGLTGPLVDRAVVPRAKVCGCWRSGAALAALGAGGLGGLVPVCGAIPLDRVRLGAGRWSAEIHLDGGAVLSRERFDAALIEEAVQAGVAFLPGTW